jgi:hypothetical protein
MRLRTRRTLNIVRPNLRTSLARCRLRAEGPLSEVEISSGIVCKGVESNSSEAARADVRPMRRGRPTALGTKVRVLGTADLASLTATSRHPSVC